MSMVTVDLVYCLDNVQLVKYKTTVATIDSKLWTVSSDCEWAKPCTVLYVALNMQLAKLVEQVSLAICGGVLIR